MLRKLLNHELLHNQAKADKSDGGGDNPCGHSGQTVGRQVGAGRSAPSKGGSFKTAMGIPGNPVLKVVSLHPVRSKL